jgi:diguanylate cyclase (GGDEF)-like protein
MSFRLSVARRAGPPAAGPGVRSARYSWLLAWLCICVAPTAAAIPIQAEEWVPATVQASPLDDGADGSFQRFDPTRLHRVERNPDGRWLRLRPADGVWPSEPLLLLVERVVFGSVELWLPGAAEPVTAGIADSQQVGLSGIAAPVFELPQSLPAGASLYLHFLPHPTHAPGVRLTVEPLADYLRRNALWVAFVSACLAAMAMMMATALVFLAILRDRAYLFYALYLSSFIVLQTISSGYLFTVLHWHGWAPVVGLVGKLVTVLSVVSACLFLLAFVRMREFAPRLQQVVFGYVVLIGVVLGLGMLPFESVMRLARVLVNPLLALGALLLPAAALMAWRHGSRYGGYFLLGWVPLMAATFASSMQTAGAFSHWTWLDDALLPAGAFEGLVLAIGLADRALAQRRRFRETEQLSMVDPLTGLINRRAWELQFKPLVARADHAGLRVYVLFVDLDHFKSLNDHFGHRAGDQALIDVASVMRSIVPSPGLVCRYGGEEFVAALVVDNSAAARSIAETLRAAVASLSIPVDAKGHTLTLSIGLARHGRGDAADDTVEQADNAMYRAKAGGRNRVMALSDGEVAKDSRA